jgi:hypothetical protein
LLCRAFRNGRGHRPRGSITAGGAAIGCVARSRPLLREKPEATIAVWGLAYKENTHSIKIRRPSRRSWVCQKLDSSRMILWCEQAQFHAH